MHDGKWLFPDSKHQFHEMWLAHFERAQILEWFFFSLDTLSLFDRWNSRFFVWFAFPLFLFWGCDSISITPPIFGWIENIQIERLTHFGAGCDMSTNCFVDAIGSIKITHALLYNRKKKEYLFIWRCNRSTSVLRTHWFIHSLWLYVWWMNKRFQCYIARWNRIFECDVV